VSPPVSRRGGHHPGHAKEIVVTGEAQERIPSMEIAPENIISRVDGFGLHSAEIVLNDRRAGPARAPDTARILFVLEGTLVDVMGAHETICSAGTVIFRPPGLEHSLRVVEVPLRIVLVEIDDRQLQQFNELFAEPGHPAHLRTEPLGPNIPRRLLSELRSADAASPMAIHALICSLVVSAARLIGRQSRHATWVDDAVRLIEGHYHEPLSLRDVAQSLGIAAERLAHQFRSDLGCTVGQFIRRLRVDRAAHLLTDTTQPLGDIATMTGFYDQSHFAKIFKELTGQTPSQFRLEHQSS
jgi:AraC family transcriptional regulator